MIILKVRFLALFFTAAIFVAPTASRAEQPGAEEVKQLLLAFAKSQGVSPSPKLEIRAVMSCYPMIEHTASDVICLVDGKNGTENFEVVEVPFSKKPSGWSLMDPEGQFTPACPQKEEATPLLRKSLGDPGAEVTDVPEEGVFSDDRGMNRDKKGPMRLMCVYGVKGALGERTVVGYFRFEGGKYLMDEDKEVWTN